MSSGGGVADDPLPPERLYPLWRVEAGDYLFASNDTTTLYRVRTYVEDGSAEYRDERGRWHVVTGTYWAGYVYAFGTPEQASLDDDVLDWTDDSGRERWTLVITGQRRRADVVEYLLTRDA